MLPNATVDATRLTFEAGVQDDSFNAPLTVPDTLAQVTPEVLVPVQPLLAKEKASVGVLGVAPRP